VTLDGFHLPALERVATTTWTYGEGAGEIRLRIPQLTPDLLRAQAAALREARDVHLRDRPVLGVVRAIDRAAARLRDASHPLRRRAEEALPAVTGCSPQMARLVLERMTADWREGPLLRLLEADLGDPAVLDGFVPRPTGAGRTRAYGPALTAHVFSGNVPGVSVTSLVRSLLVKSAALGKMALGEPVLAALFARAVAEEDAALGACLAVAYWPGGDESLERAALEGADAVIAYGGPEAVAAARAATPAGARFLGYGHRLSFGIAAREALAAEGAAALADAAALDVATFDQQGCVSPHLYYVEEGGATSPRTFAALLAASLARLESVLPRGTLAPGEAAAIRQLRGEMEFARLAGGDVELHASPDGTRWTVVFDPDPAFAASCLNRVVRVKPVPELDVVPELVRPIAPVLQSVGVAGPESRTAPVAAALGRLGASRLAPFGSLAWPPATWHHDGRPPLAELVRWCDWE
jgi:hypothetical protein